MPAAKPKMPPPKTNGPATAKALAAALGAPPTGGPMPPYVLPKGKPVVKGKGKK